MPNGQYPRTAGFGTDAFARDLFEAIMPIVESEYRVKPGTENRAVAGLSMGGQQALDIGFGNLDRFDWIGAFSPAFLSGETFEENHGEALATANDNVRLVWTAIGEDDGLLSRYNNLPPLLDRYGVKYTSTITSGAHEWDVWRKYLRDFASLLFR